MSNTFGAHIFKRRSVGEREEVTIKLFNADGSPFEGGGGGADLSQAVLSVFQGVYDEDVDYPAGSLVRHNGWTWLATEDAPAGPSALAPGSSGALATVAVVRQSNGTTVPGYVLSRNEVVPLAGLTKQAAYYLNGQSAYFRVNGFEGERVTLAVTGSTGSTSGQVLHPYAPDGTDLAGGSNFTSPQTWTIPAGDHFGVEVNGGSTSIRLEGESDPVQAEGNPWVLFA